MLKKDLPLPQANQCHQFFYKILKHRTIIKDLVQEENAICTGRIFLAFCGASSFTPTIVQHCNPLLRHGHIPGININAHKIALQTGSYQARGPQAKKRVQDIVAGGGAGFDAGFNQLFGEGGEVNDILEEPEIIYLRRQFGLEVAASSEKGVIAPGRQPCIGIDVGTTTSEIAYTAPAGRPILQCL
ncbi:hypothetical protein [Moorella sp. Hama-1]|uniref:hypothetical protein n=1 Tax=Moorella sp. Hama-1 TaxID=2138101 RepID=UPI00207302BE|nr:hypothetical protein [Moorella sp. Hama-1]